MVPKFDIIPIIADKSGVYLGTITIVGFSTRAGAKSDDGRLYADVTISGSGFQVDLFSDYARSGNSLVMRGTATGVGRYFLLAAQNASGMSGRARLDGSGTPGSAIVVVTFATDADVMKSEGDVSGLPGYDPIYGLASFHARAMKRLLTSDLPSAIPYLFKDLKVSAFVPLSGLEAFPDLTLIQSPEALRDAQANLVKSLSAQEQEHQAEFSEVAELARERFALALRTLASANAPKEDEAKSVTPSNTVRFTTFTRG